MAGQGHVKLPVRVRRRWRGNGSERALLVYCPEQRGSRGIERCRECVRCQGLGMDEHGISHVLCDTTVEERARKIMPTAAEVTPAAALMQHEVSCVSPSLSRHEAAQLLAARGLAAVPVVDDEGRPLGILRALDLLDDGRPARACAGECMIQVGETLLESDPVSRAAALVAAAGADVLVVGDYGRVVGIVGAIELARWLARQSGYDV